MTHPTYSAFYLKIWSFSIKAKYARLRTLPRSLVGSRGSSFQPCNVPRRIKGFALRLVKSEELRMENASPTGTCRTGETRRTINQTIRRIYHCPDPHLPLLLNSSNHQSHLSHMSHSSHYSNSGAEHTPNSSTHPLTFRPFGRFLCKLAPASIKDHSSLITI